jgi:hypothetical protein
LLALAACSLSGRLERRARADREGGARRGGRQALYDVRIAGPACPADLSADGALDLFDFPGCVNAFNQGC